MKPIKSSKKILLQITLVVFCVLLIAGVGGGLYLFDFAIVRKPPLSNVITPKMKRISATMAQSRIDGQKWLNENNAEKITVTTEDGINLVGYLIKAENQLSNRLVILIHGHRSNAAMMGNYGKYYKEKGFHVFMADNRGHGESGGNYVGFGWLDRLDYILWMNTLLERLGNDTQIVLHGISMGASTALMISGEDNVPKQTAAIVSDCGFSSVEDEIKYQIKTFFHLPTFPIVNIGSLASKLFAGYSFKEASAIKQVKKSNIPIFIIHGDADTYNPAYMAHAIYNAAAGEKEIWIVPSVDHAMSYYDNPIEYFHKVEEFLNKHVF